MQLVDPNNDSRRAVDLRAAVVGRASTALAVTRRFLDRIESSNAVLNAVCTLNPAAEVEAEAIDARLSAGQVPRALEGVPFLAKDNLDTRNLRTTLGSEHLRDRVPDADAISVARLRKHGAVLLGKSNTPEFAADINTTNTIFGQTRNPWDLNTTPGGSSGGTGAAVASGQAPIGLGTDLGGSIRIPASFNGICGLRPCPGRVPVRSADFAWETLVPHVQGPMATSVADLGLMMTALAGPDSRDPISLPAQPFDYIAAGRGEWAIGKPRIAYLGDMDGLIPMHAEVRAVCRAAAGRFEDLGAQVVEDAFDASDVPEIIAGTRAFNIIGRYQAIFEAHEATLGISIRNQVQGASRYDVRAVTEAERARTRYWHRVQDFMLEYEFLVLPTVGVPAFRLDEPLPSRIDGKPVANFYDAIRSTYAFSLLGLPVLAVPAGFTVEGLPIGIQIVGPRFREDAVLALGAAYEKLRPELFDAVPNFDPGELKDVHPEFETGGVPLGR